MISRTATGVVYARGPEAPLTVHEPSAPAPRQPRLLDRVRIALRARHTKWRQYDPADTDRFYALRLHEVGMVKSTPQKILAQGTEWSFLNEPKKELKG